MIALLKLARFRPGLVSAFFFASHPPIAGVPDSAAVFPHLSHEEPPNKTRADHYRHDYDDVRLVALG